MPSNLRIQHSFEPIEATHSYFPSAPSPPLKKQKMSLTQTYYIAASARSKLGREACRPDHDLRLLVGHANLLDSLMLELQDAEREQEAWFNQTVRSASRDESKSRQHIEWADTIMEDEDDEDDSSDAASDSSDDSDYDDYEMVTPRPRLSIPSIKVTPVEFEIADDEESDEEDYYDYDDDEVHALTRVSSHSSPPELIEDDESSEDEAPPASPPQQSLEYEQPLYSKSEDLAKDNYFISRQNNLLITSF